MSETKTEYKTKKEKKKEIPSIGYIDTDEGRIYIKGKATGQTLYRAVDPGYKGNTTAAIISQLCTLDGKPITIEQVEELDSGLTIAINEAISTNAYLKPIDVASYPQKYELVTDDGTKQIELIEKRKIKHDNEALKLAMNVSSRVGFWIVNMLVRVDGKHLNLEEIKKLPASEVEALMELVTPKKYTFVAKI